MLSGVLGFLYRRRDKPIKIQPTVKHGHFMNLISLRNVVALWRDPRDRLVLSFCHCYFINHNNNAGLVQLMRANCPFENYIGIRVNISCLSDSSPKTKSAEASLAGICPRLGPPATHGANQLRGARCRHVRRARARS